MSERKRWSRRRIIETAIATPLAATPVAAQHEGHSATVTPHGKHEQYLTAHEFATLRVLCDLIIPADDVSPAASQAGAVEYIDLLCRNNATLARTYHGGLAWLDSTSRNLHGSAFRDSSAAQQTAILEKLAYREKTPPEWKAGAEFFDWVRRMTLDAFYTSPIGYQDVGYKGGHGMTTYQVPEAVLRQALAKVKL